MDPPPVDGTTSYSGDNPVSSEFHHTVRQGGKKPQAQFNSASSSSPASASKTPLVSKTIHGLDSTHLLNEAISKHGLGTDRLDQTPFDQNAVQNQLNEAKLRLSQSPMPTDEERHKLLSLQDNAEHQKQRARLLDKTKANMAAYESVTYLNQCLKEQKAPYPYSDLARVVKLVEALHAPQHGPDLDGAQKTKALKQLDDNFRAIAKACYAPKSKL